MNPQALAAKSRAGIAAYREGDPARAALCFSEILAAAPGHQAARINLANACWALRDFAAATMHAQAALAADPDSVEAWMIAGAIRLDDGDASGAVAAYQAAVKLRPGRADAQAGLAAGLLAAEDFAGAEQAAALALTLSPGDPHAWFTLASAKLRLGQIQAALALFDALIGADPRHAQARHNRANALIDLNRLAEAAAELQRCLALAPALKEAWATLGYLLTIQGEAESAVAACERAIAIDPDFAVAQWNRGVALLLSGDFGAGFAAYEWRKRHPVLGRGFTKLPAPAWQGENLAGKHLLVRAEQGFGDTIMLSRFFPQLAARAAQVSLCCAPDLFALFRDMNIQLLPLDATPPAVDLAVDQMSLPHILQLSEASIPASALYLYADPQRAARFNRMLPGRPRIGLVWAGNPGHDNDRHRSLPPGALAPLLAMPGFNFVSLQIGARQSEYPIADIARAIRDYGDTAAVISQLDAVVSVDTSVAHLAGALGIACHLLLSTACDWRWRLGREDTAWYDSLTLHRQRRLDDWGGPIASVMASLRGLAVGRGA